MVVHLGAHIPLSHVEAKQTKHILLNLVALLGKSRRRELARPTRELRVSAEGYSRIVRVLYWA